MRSRTAAVGVAFLVNSSSSVTSWSCVALCRFWFFCCCVRVLLRGGRRDADEVDVAAAVELAIDAAGEGVDVSDSSRIRSSVCIVAAAPWRGVEWTSGGGWQQTSHAADWSRVCPEVGREMGGVEVDATDLGADGCLAGVGVVCLEGKWWLA